MTNEKSVMNCSPCWLLNTSPPFPDIQTNSEKAHYQDTNKGCICPWTYLNGRYLLALRKKVLQISLHQYLELRRSASLDALELRAICPSSFSICLF